MNIDDLPRLSDEERDLHDSGYVSIPSCPQGAPQPRLPGLAKILVAITALLAAGCSMSTVHDWAGTFVIIATACGAVIGAGLAIISRVPRRKPPRRRIIPPEQGGDRRHEY